MDYSKRIVLDFDDTLAHTANRDWMNAKPNIELITKVNNLYDHGWIIDIYTARGSISCPSREEADKKYRVQIECWLKLNGVKYHSLSFDKPLAAYYVDDKSLTPEQFIDIDIRPLVGGLTGSDVFTDGKYVHKTDKNSHLVHQWFNTVKDILNVPKVERIVGDTITMEYIEDDKTFFSLNHYLALGLIQETLDKLKSIPIQSEIDYNQYVERIKDHVELAGNPIEFVEILNSIKDIKLDQTFSHGDFGITNLLFKDKNLYLIDPITNGFGCVTLDSAKLCASLIINRFDPDQIMTTIYTMALYNRMELDPFVSLVKAEIIRVYKYHPNKEFIMECATCF